MSNKFSPNPRTYSKRNFIEILELITPEFYESDDIALSGLELDPISDIINRHVQAANNISTVLSLSAVANSQTSALNNISGISQYFVKQNDLTKINTYLFETKILNPLGKTIISYDTSSSFYNYLSGTLLPMIIPATGSKDGPIVGNIGTLSALTSDSNPSSVHNYLVDNLGWFYFLNTSADGGLEWDPSGYVLSSLATLHSGGTLGTQEGLTGFQEYLWRNYETCTTFSNLNLVPTSFVSGTSDTITEVSAGVPAYYTSGIQKLENLQTLVDVIYSPAYMDQQDYRVETAFNDYMNASTKLSNEVSKGPLRKYLTAMGFSIADVTEQIEQIGVIYDVDNAKDEHLQYIADLIGWQLWGNSPGKWRQQLKTAVEVYKRKGTKDALNYALSSILSNNFIDVGAKVQELWESYIPYLIWYCLGTGSPHFKSLNTWTPGLANQAGVWDYNTSSLEENLKIVTDYILLDTYKKFPNNFIFYKDRFPVSKLLELDEFGIPRKYNENPADVYCIAFEKGGAPYHIHRPTDPGYLAKKAEAKLYNEIPKWKASHSTGPLGYGVYMAGLTHPTTGERPLYLSATGDLDFVFNFRGHQNFPIPPFEEIKYYRECALSPEIAEYIKERLICFGVTESLATQLKDFIITKGITTDTDLGSLNEFLMLFSGVQNPPNYDDVLFNISDYDSNILGLWNGKSSHIFIDFLSSDFDFTNTDLAGDGRYGLYETSRVTKKFIPAHTIAKINLSASALDDYTYSATNWDYLGYDKDDSYASYSSGAVNTGFEVSGVSMGTVSPGTDDGRGGLNTFWRADVDIITDNLLSSTTAITTAPRRSQRRRNFRYTLPLEGYYDRTGFNSPVSWDPSTLENSMPSSMGELTLGYVASAGKFFPVVDPVNPSGVWHECEGLDSSRAFSGIDTSTTFPYRGLSVLGSDAKNTDVSVSTARYVDRWQTPLIYIAMHKSYENKAKENAKKIISLDSSAYLGEDYWKNNIQSLANEAIASGYVLNSFDDYLNFKFGKGLHRLYHDYCTYFLKHPLNPNEQVGTGGNIFGQVFGKGLYNCDFSVDGSAVEVSSVFGGDYIASSLVSSIAISQNHGSGVFSTCAVAAYSDGSQNLPASGTYIASDAGQMVVPFSGTFGNASGLPFSLEFRNPHILSGIEFADISGSPSSNEFYIFKLTPSAINQKLKTFVTANTMIKCKSLGGLPRLRFDLSAYGPRENHLIKDHKFKLNINSIVGEENAAILGGGMVGVWIHTNSVSGLMWSWTPNNKWEMHKEDDLSIDTVMGDLSHYKNFATKNPGLFETKCLGNIENIGSEQINNLSLAQMKEEFFEDFELEFDTRNYTIYNNYEYKQIIPLPDEYNKLSPNYLVHRDDTNYVVEIFFRPNTNPAKYLLIDSIGLTDLTNEDRCGVGMGFGVETSGIPLRPFVTEEKEKFDKSQLRETLNFFNGLIASGPAQYNTVVSTRDAIISSGTMEVSGGSRLNYRISPTWVSTAVGTYAQTTHIDIIN